MLVASSSTNDNWTLNSAGGIAFNGNTSLTAASALLTAAGAITGGTVTTAINTSAANGPIISGRCQPGNGRQSPGRPGGDRHRYGNDYGNGRGQRRRVPHGGWATQPGIGDHGRRGNADRKRKHDGAGHNLTLMASDATSDNWTLNSAGAIAFSGNTTLAAESAATLTAAGAITGGTAATAIDTSAANGSIVLNGASIGTSASSLGVLAGTGTVTGHDDGGHVGQRRHLLVGGRSLDLGQVSTAAGSHPSGQYQHDGCGQRPHTGGLQHHE